MLKLFHYRSIIPSNSVPLSDARINSASSVSSDLTTAISSSKATTVLIVFSELRRPFVTHICNKARQVATICKAPLSSLSISDRTRKTAARDSFSMKVFSRFKASSSYSPIIATLCLIPSATSPKTRIERQTYIIFKLTRSFGDIVCTPSRVRTFYEADGQLCFEMSQPLFRSLQSCRLCGSTRVFLSNLNGQFNIPPSQILGIGPNFLEMQSQIPQNLSNYHDFPSPATCRLDEIH